MCCTQMQLDLLNVAYFKEGLSLVKKPGGKSCKELTVQKQNATAIYLRQSDLTMAKTTGFYKGVFGRVLMRSFYSIDKH